MGGKVRCNGGKLAASVEKGVTCNGGKVTCNEGLGG